MPPRLAALAGRPFADLPLRDLGLELPQAAVLLPVWPVEGRLQLLLTRRASGMRTQPGDVALPGGRCDPGESVFDAACREAHEEVGLHPGCVEVVGRFDEAWSSAGSRVVPVVGWVVQPPVLEASPAEVDEILVLDLAELADPANHRVRVTASGEHQYRDAVISVGEVTVYGFTADLVLDLAAWMDGTDRRRSAERLADLVHFSAQHGWR